MEVLPTTCGYCSCGCAVYLEHSGGNVVSLCPSVNHPVSEGRLCIKGWNGIAPLLGSDRLKTPLVRKDGSLQPASWEEAMSITCSAIKNTSPSNVGIIGSAKTTNEECYSLVRLAREVIGTPNIDGAGRFYDASAVPGLAETIGIPVGQTDLDSIRRARSMLIAGSNVMDQLPHVGSRIIDAVKGGCRIVVADPRDTRLASLAHLYLHPRPGTDVIWLRALLATIISRQLYSPSAPRMQGFEELRASVLDIDHGKLQEACGVDAELVEKAALALAQDAPLIVMFGLGVLQQANSTAVVRALADIALLLGGCILPLKGQNNAQGAWDMGVAHNLLPGYQYLADSKARAEWESRWNCKLPRMPGLCSVDMIRACASGDIKTMLIFGENAALSAPNTRETAAALDSVEFLAVSDLYLTETAKLADVVFPACSFLEKDGTFTNIERRVQRVRKLVEPVGESKSDLEITASLAEGLGRNLPRDPSEVMRDISSYVPQYSGVSYPDMDEDWSEQWPVEFAAQLVPIPEVEAWADEDEFPFRLIAGRQIFHQQTGTMASRCDILARECSEALIELNEDDARRLGLKPGRPVTVSSRIDSLTRMLSLSDAVPAGTVHVPLYFGEDSPNRLVGYDHDPSSGVPAYKTCAVKVEATE